MFSTIFSRGRGESDVTGNSNEAGAGTNTGPSTVMNLDSYNNQMSTMNGNSNGPSNTVTNSKVSYNFGNHGRSSLSRSPGQSHSHPGTTNNHVSPASSSARTIPSIDSEDTNGNYSNTNSNTNYNKRLSTRSMNRVQNPSKYLTGSQVANSEAGVITGYESLRPGSKYNSSYNRSGLRMSGRPEELKSSRGPGTSRRSGTRASHVNSHSQHRPGTTSYNASYGGGPSTPNTNLKTQSYRNSTRRSNYNSDHHHLTDDDIDDEDLDTDSEDGHKSDVNRPLMNTNRSNDYNGSHVGTGSHRHGDTNATGSKSRNSKYLETSYNSPSRKYHEIVNSSASVSSRNDDKPKHKHFHKHRHTHNHKDKRGRRSRQSRHYDSNSDSESDAKSQDRGRYFKDHNQYQKTSGQLYYAAPDGHIYVQGRKRRYSNNFLENRPYEFWWFHVREPWHNFWFWFFVIVIMVFVILCCCNASWCPIRFG